MAKKNYDDMKIESLKKLAKKRGVKFRKNVSRKSLIALLRADDLEAWSFMFSYNCSLL